MLFLLAPVSLEALDEVLFNDFQDILNVLDAANVNPLPLLQQVDEEARPRHLMLLDRAAERHFFLRHFLKLLSVLVSALDARFALVH